MLSPAFWWYDCLLTTSGPESQNDAELPLHLSDYVRLLQVKGTKISPLYIRFASLVVIPIFSPSIFEKQCPRIPSQLSDLINLCEMCEIYI